MKRSISVLNAITGTRPPMFIKVTRRRGVFEMMRYEWWGYRRWMISDKRQKKVPHLFARLNTNNLFYMDVK